MLKSTSVLFTVLLFSAQLASAGSVIIERQPTKAEPVSHGSVILEAPVDNGGLILERGIIVQDKLAGGMIIEKPAEQEFAGVVIIERKGHQLAGGLVIERSGRIAG